MSDEPTASESTAIAPGVRDWDTCVSAALFRCLGATQQDAAKAAGCSARSIRTWEAADWWPRAVEEATGRWLGGLRAAARRRLLSAMNDSETDPSLALKVLERLEPQLSGPAARLGSHRADAFTLTDEQRAARIAGILDRARARVVRRVIEPDPDDERGYRETGQVMERAVP